MGDSKYDIRLKLRFHSRIWCHVGKWVILNTIYVIENEPNIAIWWSAKVLLLSSAQRPAFQICAFHSFPQCLTPGECWVLLQTSHNCQLSLVTNLSARIRSRNYTVSPPWEPQNSCQQFWHDVSSCVREHTCLLCDHFLVSDESSNFNRTCHPLHEACSPSQGAMTDDYGAMVERKLHGKPE
jgi:hypothetical protein